jgi:hypothetical protein
MPELKHTIKLHYPRECGTHVNNMGVLVIQLASTKAYLIIYLKWINFLYANYSLKMLWLKFSINREGEGVMF